MKPSPGGERDDEGRYEIRVAGGPGHGCATGELWLAGERVAAARLERGVLHFRLHAPSEQRWWTDEYEEFSVALHELGERLRASV